METHTFGGGAHCQPVNCNNQDYRIHGLHCLWAAEETNEKIPVGVKKNTNDLESVTYSVVCLYLQWTVVERHYPNKVSLAPLLHQAPVPHVLLPHSNPSDHALV